jgi:SAM-dependent methyltransferase
MNERFFGCSDFIALTALDDAARTARQVALLGCLLEAHAVLGVLDVGCGWGRLTLPLAELGFEVTGIDTSSVYLERARASAGRDGPRFHQIDMRELEYCAAFDAVLSMSTSFGFFADQDEDQQSLARMGAALRPGGVLVIDTIARSRCRRLAADPRRCDAGVEIRYDEERRRFEKRVYDPPTQSYTGFSLRIYDPDELFSMLEQCGLQVEQLIGDYEGQPFDHDSPRMIVVATRTEGK